MMPIYGQIRSNRIKTFVLFFVFTLLFAGLGFFIGFFFDSPLAGVIILLVIAGILFAVSYSSGHNIIASMAGAHPVKREEEPYLYHTVESMAIAAGLPTPKAYIIETDIPNAFAAGNRPDRAVVAVTRGLLNKMDRLELEGVIAHEMAHIKNYDVLAATVAVVMAGTIVTVSELMLHGSRYSALSMRGSRREGGGAATAIIIVLMIVVAILAPFFARMIKYSISREREYLADATAAELTGYPEGLASALEKLSGQQVAKGPLDHKALHGLYIVNPALGMKSKKRGRNLFSTHPDTKSRIDRLRKM